MTAADAQLIEYFREADAPAREVLTEAELRVLDEVNARIAGRATLCDVIGYLFEATKGISPCDRIGLAFVDEDERIVAHTAVSDYAPLRLKQGYAEPLSQTSLARIIAEGSPRIIHDLRGYSAAHPESRSSALLVLEGVRSSLTCPLRVEGRTVGVMFRSSRQAGAYSRKHAVFFLAIAERLGQAVEKTRRIEQLEEANRAYGEMLGFVSHELKSPLAGIVTNADLLLQSYVGTLDDKQQQLVARMRRSAEHLLSVTREYLDLARVEGEDLKLDAQRIDFVADVLEPAVDVVMPTIEAAEMALRSGWDDGPLELEADANLLRIVVINLLSNAAKYGRSGGTIAVRVEADGDRLTCAVRNEGPGFPESQRSRLFRRFSRLDTPALRGRKGTGVGLYTCRRIIKLHGGRIWAESEEGKWAEFSFELARRRAASQES